MGVYQGKITYHGDFGGTNALMNSPAMVEAMRQRAEAGKGFAVAISPRDTGHYADSFEVSARPHGGVRGDRAEGRLTNTAVYAMAVEFRNENGRVLGRTVDFIESE